jgi:hypothetical protein
LVEMFNLGNRFCTIAFEDRLNEIIHPGITHTASPSAPKVFLKIRVSSHYYNSSLNFLAQEVIRWYPQVRRKR